MPGTSTRPAASRRDVPIWRERLGLAPAPGAPVVVSATARCGGFVPQRLRVPDARGSSTPTRRAEGPERPVAASSRITSFGGPSSVVASHCIRTVLPGDEIDARRIKRTSDAGHHANLPERTRRSRAPGSAAFLCAWRQSKPAGRHSGAAARRSAPSGRLEGTAAGLCDITSGEDQP